MSFQTQVITVFISSPSDVANDRQIVLDEMQAWNQRNAREKGCLLSPLTWEDLVAPDMAGSGQDVVNFEVGDDYDVFLGLMWSRFGTPTLQADSGTEEEFERALGRKQAGDALRISFFFRNSEISIDEIDTEQLAKVRSFKKSISERGAFYGQYASDRELVSGLTTLFDRIANEKYRYVQGRPNSGAEGGKPASDESEEKTSTELASAEDDAGLFDLEDVLNADAEALSNSLAEWGAQFTITNAAIERATARITELSQFAQPDRAELREQIDNVTAVLVSFSRFANEHIGNIEDRLESIYRHISAIMDIVQSDFDPSEEKVESDRQHISILSRTVSEAEAIMTQYIDVVESLPRIDKNFNRARDSIVIVHKRLRKKMRDFNSRLQQIVI